MGIKLKDFMVIFVEYLKERFTTRDLNKLDKDLILQI